MLTTIAEKDPSTLHEVMALSTFLLDDEKLVLALTLAHQRPNSKLADPEMFDSCVDELLDVEPTEKATLIHPSALSSVETVVADSGFSAVSPLVRMSALLSVTPIIVLGASLRPAVVENSYACVVLMSLSKDFKCPDIAIFIAEMPPASWLETESFVPIA